MNSNSERSLEFSEDHEIEELHEIKQRAVDRNDSIEMSLQIEDLHNTAKPISQHEALEDERSLTVSSDNEEEPQKKLIIDRYLEHDKTEMKLEESLEVKSRNVEEINFGIPLEDRFFTRRKEADKSKEQQDDFFKLSDDTLDMFKDGIQVYNPRLRIVQASQIDLPSAYDREEVEQMKQSHQEMAVHFERLDKFYFILCQLVSKQFIFNQHPW